MKHSLTGFSHRDRHWIARVGLQRQRSQSPSEQRRRIDAVILHELYASDPIDRFDLALLHMRTPVRFGPLIRPPTLPKTHNDSPLPGQYCTAIGWGYSDERAMELGKTER